MAEFQKVPENTLVMAGKLYREAFSEQMTEAAYAQAISRLCKTGEIQRIAKGVYCCPKKSHFGTVPPSEREIVEQFTKGNMGIVIGYDLYNSLGITTQISKNVELYSSAIDEQSRKIGNVIIYKANLDYRSEIKAIISLMEPLYHYRDIQDINYASLLCASKTLAQEYDDAAFQEVQTGIGYPKWTIAFLKEILKYHRIPNALASYLSTLSNYRIPRLEKLFEVL